MTHLFGIRDPGRSGGSWVAYCCNVHPAVMRVLGEVHVPTQLDFPYPSPKGEYDRQIIVFLQSQMDQKIAAAGIIKCFQPYSQKFIREHKGRIVQLVRNPMEVAGFNVYKKIGAAERMLGHPARDQDEDFHAHMLYYELSYNAILHRRKQEPIIRIEDLNRSCGGDGQFFKAVMEYMTQTDWPVEYIKHIQRWYLPGYHYPFKVVKRDGIVVGIETTPFAHQLWRLSWGDDPRPGEYWQAWTPKQRTMFTSALTEVSRYLGYDCLDNPGFTEIDWPLRDTFPWAGAGQTLQPVPHESDYESRLPRKGKVGLPAFGGDTDG